jgi:hypothetical protein
MRPYFSYIRFETVYFLFDESESYEQYIRFTRSYDFAWPAVKIDCLNRADEALQVKMTEAR